MRVFIAVLVLIFSLQSLTKGDDIFDLEIEGISIGDSLLKLMNKSEITTNMSQLYKSKKFSTVAYYDSEIYDMVQFSFLTNDDNFIVHDIEGKLFFNKDIKSCLKKQKEVSESIKEIIGGYTEYHPIDEQTRKADPSGKSMMYTEVFLFSDGWSMVQIYCTDWSERLENEEKFKDELKISIWSEAFSKFLEYEAY